MGLSDARGISHLSIFKNGLRGALDIALWFGEVAQVLGSPPRFPSTPASQLDAQSQCLVDKSMQTASRKEEIGVKMNNLNM